MNIPLQSLQGHYCGQQFFIPDLNEFRELEFFRSRSRISHILVILSTVSCFPLKTILVNNVLLVVDLIIQQDMILDIMTAQLRTNFRSDPLEEMCKVLQENLNKYVINLCRNKENKMSLRKFIVALVVRQVRD